MCDPELKQEIQGLRGEVHNLAGNVSNLTGMVHELAGTVSALSGRLTDEQIERRDTDLELFKANTRRSIRVELPVGPKWVVTVFAALVTAAGAALTTYLSGGGP